MLKKIIYEAYCNEIANDKFGSKLSNKNNLYNDILYFKNYKVTNLSKKNFYVFLLMTKIHKKLWLLSILYFTIQFIISIFIFKKINKNFKNVAFINANKSLYDISLININNVEYLNKNFYNFSCYSSFYDKMIAYILVYKVIFLIIKNKNSLSNIEYNSLKFHIYDLYLLCLFSLILKSKEINFYTNSHYDRWVYITSKFKNINLHIIQHGFLTKEINFPFKFGNISILHIYDKKFIDLFKFHFSSIKTVNYIKPGFKLKQTNTNTANKSIFIASSMISINLEKDIINWLLSKNRYKIYIKLHPAYNYRNEFIEYENKIEFIDYFPKVDYMISYNSFLGYEYKALGEKVLWIKNYENKLNDLYKELEFENTCVE
ncbi:MAG: hypothetical protein PHS78_08345 [Aliarcobacter skirrowii]|uniref:hypothetical protein n=1 Tax=Aliarcobacter skirrowii TaxID=28200 RepID=UPI00242B32B8|nr:hypothetical protein [Aliarcobacter skirrowii]MDD2509033.1 hypothetical protein [Aliarcobacter skirrowii]MDD3497772.1 hypothetical protein [Aliarcobacter skirrowii]